MIGIGYQQYRTKFRTNENKESERYLIYFGRAHIIDYTSNNEAKGPMKIGRGKWATAIMRGRNQAGIDFRIYSEIIVENNKDTYLAEHVVQDMLSHKNIPMSQGQRELYDIQDEELREVVEKVVEVLNAETNIKILEVNHYY
jgi:hypothetical protein